MGSETGEYGEARGVLLYLCLNLLQKYTHVLLMLLKINFKRRV